LQYNFCIGFEFENLISIYWYLEMTQSTSMKSSSAMITVCEYYIKPR